jgi:hypothetical protein
MAENTYIKLMCLKITRWIELLHNLKTQSEIKDTKCVHIIECDKKEKPQVATQWLTVLHFIHHTFHLSSEGTEILMFQK